MLLEKKNVLVYGLEYIICSLVKILSLLLGSWILGIFPEAIAFLLT
ncbi:accessory gene regulator B family protein [Desulfofarcimen acetoxidans]